MIHAEATIDIDQHRRVWAQVDGNVEKPEDIAAVSLAAASAAFALYDKALQEREKRTAQRVMARKDEQEREKLRTFGDED